MESNPVKMSSEKKGMSSEFDFLFSEDIFMEQGLVPKEKTRLRYSRKYVCTEIDIHSV